MKPSDQQSPKHDPRPIPLLTQLDDLLADLRNEQPLPTTAPTTATQPEHKPTAVTQ